MPGLNMHRSESDMMLREESSDQSLLSVMSRFVQAVGVMDETVMIPMRLKDLPVDPKSKPNKGASNIKQERDMYEAYYMLHAIKSELVSGPKSRSESECETDDRGVTLKTIPVPKSQSQHKKKVRKNNVQQSDSESSMADSNMSSDSEITSGFMSDDSESEDQIQMVAPSDVTTNDDDAKDLDGESPNEKTLLFRHHLQGLHAILKELTQNAQLVTNKYQEEIGGNSSNMSQLPTFTL